MNNVRYRGTARRDSPRFTSTAGANNNARTQFQSYVCIGEYLIIRALFAQNNTRELLLKLVW